MYLWLPLEKVSGRPSAAHHTTLSPPVDETLNHLWAAPHQLHWIRLRMLLRSRLLYSLWSTGWTSITVAFTRLSSWGGKNKENLWFESVNTNTCHTHNSYSAINKQSVTPQSPQFTGCISAGRASQRSSNTRFTTADVARYSHRWANTELTPQLHRELTRHWKIKW